MEANCRKCGTRTQVTQIGIELFGYAKAAERAECYQCATKDVKTDRESRNDVEIAIATYAIPARQKTIRTALHLFGSIGIGMTVLLGVPESVVIVALGLLATCFCIMEIIK